MANRIAKARQVQGLTRTQLAAQLGVGEYTVARWEKERTGVPDHQKLAMAELFGIDVAYLMGWTDENGNSNGNAAA